MNLVIEGADNSGKSTLAKRIQQKLAWPIKDTEGPPKYAGEINDRASKYLSLTRTIIDRHPCVSQMIYGPFRNSEPIDQHILLRFYSSRPLIIYCLAPLDRNPTGNTQKGYDTADHQSLVRNNDAEIKSMYDSWALAHANVFYRWWDEHPSFVPDLVSTYLNYGARS